MDPFREVRRGWIGLESTFLHLPSVGPATERNLWRAGIRSWDDLEEALDRGVLPGWGRISGERVREWRRALRASRAALAAGDASFFASLLPPREHWRAAREFLEDAVFLDVETTGVGWLDGVTVVGVSDGAGYRALVRGRGLERLGSLLEGKKLLVTFFGSVFDLPVLRREFPGLPLPVLHVDLCFLLRRLGYTGGLKRVEALLGLGRPGRVLGMGGRDAVLLWREFVLGGDALALDLLVEYNRADVENLRPLLEFACSEMSRRLMRF